MILNVSRTQGASMGWAFKPIGSTWLRCERPLSAHSHARDHVVSWPLLLFSQKEYSLMMMWFAL